MPNSDGAALLPNPLPKARRLLEIVLAEMVIEGQITIADAVAVRQALDPQLPKPSLN